MATSRLNKIDFWAIGSFIIGLILCFVFYKGYMTEPNNLMMAFGGDGYVIYYDIMYHICHDQGTMLNGMNYPDGEYVFLTDAEGGLSQILQWLQRWGIDTCKYGMGITHILVMYLLPLAGVMLYYLLRRLKVRPATAMIGGVLIAFMSPQMIRVGGHFGLAYPFVIPMLILWSLRKYRLQKFEKRDIIVIGLLLFFTFNNPYVGFASALICLTFGSVVALAGKFKMPAIKSALWVSLAPLVAVLSAYITFKINDPFTDRVDQQGGFFLYHASPSGNFFPPNSFLQIIIDKLKIPHEIPQFESWQNFGLVVSLALLAMIISSLVKRVRKSNEGFKLPKEYQYLIWGSLILYVYAANYSLIGFAKPFMEEHLGVLLMFKASGRLAWPTFFILSVASVAFIDYHAARLRMKNLGWLFLGGFALIWAAEIYKYQFKEFHKNEKFHDNYFGEAKRNDIRKIIESNNIDIEEFQALMVVPKMMAWSDKFFSDIHWGAQFYSKRISFEYGIPMIPAMLSRMSVSHSGEKIEMLSAPLIKRSLMDRFPNRKDLLLLLGAKEDRLQEGEQFLVDTSTPLYQSDDFSLYRLKLDDINNNKYRMAADSIIASGYNEKALYRHNFDTMLDTITYFDEPVGLMPKDRTRVYEYSPNLTADTMLTVSTWTHFDNHKSGSGMWHVQLVDSTGTQSLFYERLDNRWSNDVHDDWIRMEIDVPYVVGGLIKLTFEAQYEMLISNVHLDYKGHNSVYYNPRSKKYLFNNFRLD